MADITKTLKSTRVVKGNTFKITIPMQQITGYDSSGNPILTDVDLTGCEADTSVTLYSMYGKTVKEFTISGINISFAVDGDLNNGQYDIEVKTVKNGQKLRMDLKNALRIVNYNEDADLPSGVEFGVNTYVLQPQIIFAVGKDGDNGKSAYELAKENGFAGTVAEWLASLKGLQGYKGDKGDAGIQGIQGEKGEKGDKGDTFTFDDMTEEQKASLKGDKGDKGDAFTFADFTDEEIAALQKPATDAAATVENAKQDAETAAGVAITAAKKAVDSAAACDDTNKSVTDAEASRVTAETSRVNAENARVSEFNTMKTNSENATTEANEAATKADTAASHAPKIVDGIWHTWDTGTQSYVSTGIKAAGTDGITPQLRINSTTFNWELSIDGVVS